MVEELTPESLNDIVLSGSDGARSQFANQFGDELDEFAQRACATYNRFVRLDREAGSDRRSAWVRAFLYHAFDNVVTSVHLLTACLMLPAGNLMRSFCESVAMALLCSCREINTFEKFDSDPSRFSVNKSVDFAMRKRNAQLLGIDRSGWSEFRRICAHFDDYSHASAFSVSALGKFSEPGAMILVSEFDTSKIEAYKKELGLRISACPVLDSTIERVTGLLG